MSAAERFLQKIGARAGFSKRLGTSKSPATTLSKARQYVLLAALFFTSFLGFLYVTFPYEVLKEALSIEISQVSGYEIRIGDMSPSFPLGLALEKVVFSKSGAPKGLTLDKIKVKISLLSFLIGRIAPSLEVKSKKGSLEIDVSLGLFSLIGGQVEPRHAALKAADFPLDEIFSFILGAVSSGPSADPLVGPFLQNLAVSGSLDGGLEFELDTKNPTQSLGKMDLALKNAVLKLDHDSLGFPNLKFKPAGIKAKIQSGSIVFDESSGFYSDDLKIQITGSIMLKPEPAKSQLDLRFLIQLDKGLKEKIGFVLDAIRGTATADGKLTVQLRGAVGQPVVNNF
jgi:hypothetical protein